MAREELISSAVTFLQDPSVASSPIEKRVAFLQSKNLTQEEIDLALSRAGEDPSAAASAVTTTSSSQGYTPQQAAYRSSPPTQGYGYPPYQWQPPPPEPPKRDWRDWFIMATVMGGVGYGLYTVAKRYVSPLVAPPTPPQLEQDKKNVDEEFARAFALIEQLSTDTAALKSAEETRTERLDTTLRDVESLVGDLKSASRRRDDETRRISDEVKTLKDAIPKALQGAREGNEQRLKELGTELKSLKVLLGNRIGGGAGGASSPVAGRTVGTNLPVASPRPAEEQPTTPPPTTNGATTPATSVPESQQPQQPQQPSAAKSPSPLSQLGRSASIPAWQMAAANRSKKPDEANSTSNTTSNTEQPQPQPQPQQEQSAPAS
jgi:peroxin-14